MEQQFVLFVRQEAGLPEVAVAEFNCYSEARQLRQELVREGRWCVIRSTGETGGSD